MEREVNSRRSRREIWVRRGGDVRTRGDGGKIGKSKERQLRAAGQCFNVINDILSMLQGRRYQRVTIGWILEAHEKKLVYAGEEKIYSKG